MKEIFSDESQIYIDHGDGIGSFVWCSSNKTFKDICTKIFARVRLEIFFLYVSIKRYKNTFYTFQYHKHNFPVEQLITLESLYR